MTGGGAGGTMIDVCKDGTVTIRERGEPPFNGAALPAYEVPDRDTAEAIRVQVCKLVPDDHPELGEDEPWYKLPGFGGKVDDLRDAMKTFAKAHDRLERGGDDDDA